MLAAVFSMLVVATPAISALPPKATVLGSVNLVNNYWINGHSNTGTNLWDNSVYHIGNMAAWSVTNNATYLNYSTSHAQKNNWLLNGGTSTTDANNFALGQVYLRLTSDPTKLANTKLQTDVFFKNTSYDDLWTWIDAYFMQSDVFTRLGNLYGNGGASSSLASNAVILARPGSSSSSSSIARSSSSSSSAASASSSVSSSASSTKTINSNNGFVNSAITSQTGSFTATFDATPSISPSNALLSFQQWRADRLHGHGSECCASIPPARSTRVMAEPMWQ